MDNQVRLWVRSTTAAPSTITSAAPLEQSSQAPSYAALHSRSPGDLQRGAVPSRVLRPRLRKPGDRKSDKAADVRAAPPRTTDDGLRLKLAGAKDPSRVVSKWLESRHAREPWNILAPVAIRTILAVAKSQATDWTQAALLTVLAFQQGWWNSIEERSAKEGAASCPDKAGFLELGPGYRFVLVSQDKIPHFERLLNGLRAMTETFVENAATLDAGVIKKFLHAALWTETYESYFGGMCAMARPEPTDRRAPEIRLRSVPLQELLVRAVKSGMGVEGCGAMVAAYRGATFDSQAKMEPDRFRVWVKDHAKIVERAATELYGPVPGIDAADPHAVARSDFTRALVGRLVDGQVRAQVAQATPPRADAKGVQADG